MNYSETSPLNDRYREHDVDARDLDAESLGDQRAETRQYGSRPAQLRSDRPSISKRIMRSLARFFFAILIGVGGTLAWQSYGDEAMEMLRTSAPSLGWLLPVSTRETPAPALTFAELRQQLKPMMLELAIMRRSIDQFAPNQDQRPPTKEHIPQPSTHPHPLN